MSHTISAKSSVSNNGSINNDSTKNDCVKSVKAARILKIKRWAKCLISAAYVMAAALVFAPVSTALFIQPSHAAIDVYDFDSEQQEAQYRALIEEFRCPKCQNQNLAGSDAPIAQDLKQKTYDMVKEGKTDAQIRTYMQERYGDFISYKPPVRPSTWLLWFFPPILLVLALAGWYWRMQKKRHALIHDGGRVIDNSKTVSSDGDVVNKLSAQEQAVLDRLLAGHNDQATGANPTLNPNKSPEQTLGKKDTL